MTSAIACSSTAQTLAASKFLSPIRVISIPHLVPYTLGTALQEHLYKRRIDARAFLRELPTPSPASARHSQPSTSRREALAHEVASTDHLLLLQHAPVFSEGKRQKELDSELADACRKLGVDYVQARRGGLITYHGVGQITGYPSLDLAPMQLSVKCYVSYLETLFRNLLASPPYNVPTVDPPEGNTGVWADEYHKIVSLGVQVRHRLTLDGFGFNVSDDPLRFFRLIVACGIRGRHMTSLRSELGKAAAAKEGKAQDDSTALSASIPTTWSMMPVVADHFGRQFGRLLEELEGKHVQYEVDSSSSWRDENDQPLSKLNAITLYGERIGTPHQ
ncbi:hypothetical protein V8E36_001770 [Tilletia maclaganii]